MKNFSYTYTLFKGNHCIQSKIIEYGIILLRKYKVKHRRNRYYSLFYSQIKRIFGQM